MKYGKKIMVTLTPAESKRLIARYVAKTEMIKKAREEGIISLQLSSTGGYIYEELSGEKIEKSGYICGFLSGAGGCGAFLPGESRKEYYFEKGEEKYLDFPDGDFSGLFQKMGPKDVIIKSGNLLDRNGKACVFAGEPSGNGGEWGKAYEYVKKNKIQVLVPMTLNKSANITIEQITELVRAKELDWDKTHVIADVLPLPGIVVTEADAIRGLCGAEALPAAMSGVSTGEGTVTLCVYGTAEAVDKSWELITSIKGEPPLEVRPRCGVCSALKNKGVCKVQKKMFVSAQG